MSGANIRYDLLVQDALLGVVRKVLAEAAREGAPGDHHFFLSFRTRAPGVQLSSRMRAKYPDEITIVLQHQYWDLTVTEAQFEVNLSFNNIPERLVVPFSALTGFQDPAAPFELRFLPQPEAETPVGEPDSNQTEASAQTRPAASPAPAPKPAAKPAAAARTKAHDSKPAESKPSAEKVAEKSERPAKNAPPVPAADTGDTPAGNVVSIDAFRRKT